MWTYLAILLAISTLLIVFVRRLTLYYRAKNQKETLPEENVSEEQIEEFDEIKLKKAERERAEALFQKAEQMLEAGKEEEAIKLFVQVLAIDPNHIETEKKLAVLYLQKQMFSASAALFEKLAIRENDPIHYSHLGLVLYQQNDFDGAKKAYQSALILDDSRPQRFISLAQVYRALGQNHLAIIAVNKAIAIEEENIEFLLLLSELLLESGQGEGAREVLMKVLEMEKENEEAVRMLKELEKRDNNLPS